MINHPRRSMVKDWPKYLKEYRAQHGLTQTQLADFLQISLRKLHDWEAGTDIPAPYLKSALRDIEKKLL